MDSKNRNHKFILSKTSAAKTAIALYKVNATHKNKHTHTYSDSDVMFEETSPRVGSTDSSL